MTSLYKEFDEDWLYALKKKYYPLLAVADPPSAVSKPIVMEGFNSKPIFSTFNLINSL